MSAQQVEPDAWLELSDAADYLGVHFTTLRRWADAGQVPCIRTPGGRRRFSRVQLTTFLAGLQQGQVAAYASMIGARSQQIAQLGHPAIQQEPWYTRLSEGQLAAMRSEGQQLMAVLMQYVSRDDGGEVFLQEGRQFAQRYGQACQRAGLSLVETLETFIHVRRNIMGSVFSAGALAGVLDDETWRLHERLNIFLDNMLLALLESYEAVRQQALPASPGAPTPAA